MTLRPEIRAAAERIQSMIEKEPYSDAGFLVSVHDGQIRRVEFTSVIKMKPTASLGPVDDHKS